MPHLFLVRIVSVFLLVMSAGTDARRFCDNIAFE